MDSSPIWIYNANLSDLDPNDLLEEMGLLGVGVGNSPNPAPLLNTSIVQSGGLGGMIASVSPLPSPARSKRGRLGSQSSLNLSLGPSPPPSSPPPPIWSSTPRRLGRGCVWRAWVKPRESKYLAYYLLAMMMMSMQILTTWAKMICNEGYKYYWTIKEMQQPKEESQALLPPIPSRQLIKIMDVPP